MSTLQAGTIFDGRYKLQSPGPVHDLGAIYYAQEAETGRMVDLLILPPQPTLGESILEEVMRVQRAVAGLQQPGLAAYERLGRAGDLVYLVREHVAGHSLARLLATSGALEPRAAVEITIQACESLAVAHRAGLVHGGLAPDSLYLAEGPEGDEEGLSVTITDVGLLPALRPALAAPGRPWGRKPYLSPEQAAGERVQPASDVYVMGSLLYLMLSGRPPFRTGDEVLLTVQHLRQQPPALHILVPDLPEPLVQIVEKALAKEPAARYRYAGQLGHILRGQLGMRAPAGPQEAGGQEPQPPASPGPPPAAPPSPRGERLVVPPPPRREPVRRAYEFVEDEDWQQEPEGIDWRMVLLLLAALIAVLGLIPLWRTLYRRYSALPPQPEPGSALPLWQEMAGEAGDRDTDGDCAATATCKSSPLLSMMESALPPPISELEDRRFFWYNIRSAEVSTSRIGIDRKQGAPSASFAASPGSPRGPGWQFGSPAYGLSSKIVVH
ncbi:MAG: serine/threonine-protein kinase [Anaerolineae bacterium]